MLFTTLFSLSIFAIIIVCSCYKKYTISVGIFFYAYYVYAQTLTLIAFMLEYGIINTLVIVFCMLISLIVSIFLLLELFLLCLDLNNENYYFKCAFKTCIPIFVLISFMLLLQTIIFFVLKNYLIVIVY